MSTIWFTPTPKKLEESHEEYHARMMQECSDWFANKLKVCWSVSDTRLTRYASFTRADGVRIKLRLADHPMDYFKAKQKEKKISFSPLNSVNEIFLEIHSYKTDKPKELVKNKFRFCC